MLLDIAKLLFQKDTREAVKELVDLIRRRPEWQAELISLDEKFDYADEPRAGLLVRFLREALLQKEWQPRRAGVAEFVIQEIVDNAFQHGKPAAGSNGVVRFNATLTPSWVSCRVTDAGPGFDLAQTLQQQANGEARGLARVQGLTSKLLQDGRNTIEVVIRSTPGAIDVAVIDGVHIVTMSGRLGHDDFDPTVEFSRIETALDRDADMLVDPSDAQYLASRALRLLTLLHRRSRSAGQKIVLVVTADTVISEILHISRYDRIFDCVHSRAEALSRLRRAST